MATMNRIPGMMGSSMPQFTTGTRVGGRVDAPPASTPSRPVSAPPMSAPPPPQMAAPPMSGPSQVQQVREQAQSQIARTKDQANAQAVSARQRIDALRDELAQRIRPAIPPGERVSGFMQALRPRNEAPPPRYTRERVTQMPEAMPMGRAIPQRQAMERAMPEHQMPGRPRAPTPALERMPQRRENPAGLPTRERQPVGRPARMMGMFGR